MTVTHKCPHCPMLCHCDMDQGICIHCEDATPEEIEAAADQFWQDMIDRDEYIRGDEF